MIEPVLTPQQAFLIYSMVFGDGPDGREPMQSKAGLDKKPREALVQAGLIRKEKRPGSAATRLVLTPAGYRWAAANLGGELMKTARAAPLLRAVLGRLRPVVEGNPDVLASLADGKGLSRPATSQERGPAKLSVADGAPRVESRIRDAYLSLTHGAVKQRVLLKDLRSRVDAPRPAVDDALLAMQEQRLLVLMKLDNPTELTPADEAAALHIAGHPRHLVYFQA